MILAPRAERLKADTAADVVVVTAAQLSATGERSLPRQIAKAAGIWLQETNPGGGAPILQGLSGNQILLVLDGVRLNDATTRTGPNQMLNGIDPATVERVEVRSRRARTRRRRRAPSQLLIERPPVLLSAASFGLYASLVWLNSACVSARGAGVERAPGVVSASTPDVASSPGAARSGGALQDAPATRLRRFVAGEPPAYPELSRRLSEQGAVDLAIELDDYGDIVRVEVLTPSGFERLDAAALAAVRTWRFAPRTGVQSNEVVRHRLVFRLTEPP